MVHEARVVSTSRPARPKTVEVFPPALRQIRVQVLDRIELVVKIAIDEGSPRPLRQVSCARFRDYHGYNLYNARALPSRILSANVVGKCRSSAASGSAACTCG